MLRDIPKDYLLHVSIRDRTGVLFAGEVEALTSENEKGEFDILSRHINFISLIRSWLVLHFEGGVVQKLSFSTGILALRDNRIEIYLGVLK